MASPTNSSSPIDEAGLHRVRQRHARDVVANEKRGGNPSMSGMTRKLTFVLAAVFAILVAGAALSGCDNGKPARQNTTI